MKLSKEVRTELERRLSYPWGQVELECDGYSITLSVQQKTPLRYVVASYVNGYIRGVWMDAKTEAPEQKFLRKVTKALVRPAERQKAEKLFGKRYVAKEALYQATYSYFTPYWPSGKVVLAHLCKVSESIEVVTELSGDNVEQTLGEYFSQTA